MYNNSILRFVLLLALLFGVVFCVVIAENINANTETWRIEAEAKKLEAESNKLTAQYELEQAKAELEVAKGQRAILEAAADSVESDRKLVEYYSTRGDIRTLLFITSLLGFFVCGIALLYILQKGNLLCGQHNTEQKELTLLH